MIRFNESPFFHETSVQVHLGRTSRHRRISLQMAYESSSAKIGMIIPRFASAPRAHIPTRTPISNISGILSSLGAIATLPGEPSAVPRFSIHLSLIRIALSCGRPHHTMSRIAHIGLE